MGTTANGLDYPELSAPANVPGDILGLAVDVDARYGLSVANTSALTLIATPFPGMRVWVTGLGVYAVYNGSAWTWPVSSTTKTTTTQGPTSGTTPLTLATSPSLTFDGVTEHDLFFTWWGITQSASADYYNFAIFDGATQIAAVRTETATTAAFAGAGGTVRGSLVPTAGAHTFTAQITRGAGTGTGTVTGSSTVPMTLGIRPAA